MTNFEIGQDVWHKSSELAMTVVKIVSQSEIECNYLYNGKFIKNVFIPEELLTEDPAKVRASQFITDFFS